MRFAARHRDPTYRKTGSTLRTTRPRAIRARRGLRERLAEALGEHLYRSPARGKIVGRGERDGGNPESASLIKRRVRVYQGVGKSTVEHPDRHVAVAWAEKINKVEIEDGGERNLVPPVAQQR